MRFRTCSLGKQSKGIFEMAGSFVPPPPHTTKKELTVVIREQKRYPYLVTAQFEDHKKTTNDTL